MNHPDDPIVCEHCEQPLTDGVQVSTGTGFMHHHCWYIANPFRPKSSFREFLWDSDDCVLVRALLERHVGLKAQEAVLGDFNRIMARKWRLNSVP